MGECHQHSVVLWIATAARLTTPACVDHPVIIAVAPLLVLRAGVLSVRRLHVHTLLVVRVIRVHQVHVFMIVSFGLLLLRF